MMKKITTLVWLIVCIDGFSQADVTSPQINLSQASPTSPNAASITKYFEIPVNLSSGIPSINIPLYIIQSGNINLPISLRYHAGGIKVNEDASWVGMGWSLSTESSITKRVNGFDDLYTSEQTNNSGPQFNYVNPDYENYFYLSGLNSITEIVDSYYTRGVDTVASFFGRLASGFVDGESDEYILSSPTINTTLYYNQKQQEYQSVGINGAKYEFGGPGYGWDIVDKDGIHYTFNSVENILNPLWEQYSTYYPTQHYLPNTWRLTSIGDSINGKSISITYQNNYQDRTVIGYSRNIEYTELYNNFNSAETEFGNDIVREGDELSIIKIESENGWVDFIKDTARRDGVTPPLKEIKIYNSDSILVKKITLSYFYPRGVESSDTSSRIFLHSIQETEYSLSGDSSIIPAYKFDYDTSIHLPRKNSYALDYWGYYNGKDTNTSYYPTLPILTNNGVPLHANRKIDTAYTRAGMLNKITYPTGGYVSFVFENNTTINDTTYTGGVRIKQIIQYDSIAKKSLIKEFEYSDGTTLYDPVFHYFYIHQGTGYGTTTMRVRISANPRFSLFPANGSPVNYGSVLEKEIGDGIEIRTRHYFTGFTFHTGYYYDNGIGVPYPKIPIASDFVGLEYKTDYYVQNSDFSWSVLNSDSSVYSIVQDSSKRIWNVQSAWVSPQGGSEWFVWPTNDPFNLDPHGIPIWGATTEHIYQTMPEIPIKTITYLREIRNSDTLLKINYYQYDPKNGNLTKSTSVNSLGDTTIQLIKYSSELISTGATSGQNEQIDWMKFNNVQSLPIEILTILKKKDSVQSFLQDATLIEYTNLKPSKIYKIFGLLSLDSFVTCFNDSTDFFKDSRYKLIQETYEMDDKKPLTVITNGSIESYIWDQDNIVAKTSNALNSQTAFTSFETNSKGNWSFSGTPDSVGGSRTGNLSYSLSSGSLTKTALDNQLYIVSYWSRDGVQNVNGSGYITGKTIGDWTYYEHQLNPSSGSISISGSGIIDEVRLYPKMSQMKSYTFKPLFGVTSFNDENNQIIFYDYSGPEKLKYVFDDWGNILKGIDYEYGKPINE